MRLTYGTTRFVILIGSVSLKFIRPRPVWILIKLIGEWVTGVPSSRLREYSESPLLSGFTHLFAGILANRNEYLVWKHSPNQFLVPTMGTFFYLVNFQARGQKVSSEELREKHPLKDFLENLPPEIVVTLDAKPRNFCRYDGEIRLLDYGGGGAASFFGRPSPRTDLVVTV